MAKGPGVCLCVLGRGHGLPDVRCAGDGPVNLNLCRSIQVSKAGPSPMSPVSTHSEHSSDSLPPRARRQRNKRETETGSSSWDHRCSQRETRKLRP